MKNVIRAILFQSILFAGVCTWAQGTYTVLDFPGSLATLAAGINTTGNVVGQYFDANTNRHGFFWNGRTYKSIDYPGAQGTAAQALNDKDQIVGWAYDSDGAYFGWLYDSRSATFAQINYPGSFNSVPVAINDAGVVSGYFFYYDRHGNSVTNGFYEIGTQYNLVHAPGSVDTSVTGISKNGVLVGYADNGFDPEDFSFYGGAFHHITIPGLVPLVRGINPAANAVVGTYILSNSQSGGFVYRKNNFESLEFPGAINTYAFGINSSGVVVGYFADQSSSKGFIWTPSSR